MNFPSSPFSYRKRNFNILSHLLLLMLLWLQAGSLFLSIIAKVSLLRGCWEMKEGWLGRSRNNKWGRKGRGASTQLEFLWTEGRRMEQQKDMLRIELFLGGNFPSHITGGWGEELGNSRTTIRLQNCGRKELIKQELMNIASNIFEGKIA